MSEEGLSIKRLMKLAAWSLSWISNGHFAARKEAVKLGNHLTSTDAVICAFPNAKRVTEMTDESMVKTLGAYDGLRVEFTRSPWQHKNAALFLDDGGNAAWFDAEYCGALHIDRLYGPSPMFAQDPEKSVPYYDAPELKDAAIVIMPMQVPVDWDLVARTVAAATSLDEAQPGALVDIPEDGEGEHGEDSVPSDSGFVASLLDQLEDPTSTAARTMAASVTAGSVTISSGSRSVTFGEEPLNA